MTEQTTVQSATEAFYLKATIAGCLECVSELAIGDGGFNRYD